MSKIVKVDVLSAKTPCPKGECEDKSQCWEPCGDLGKSDEHTMAISVSNSKTIEDIVASNMINRKPNILPGAILTDYPPEPPKHRELYNTLLIAAMTATCADNDWLSADQMAAWCAKQADAMMKVVK